MFKRFLMLILVIIACFAGGLALSYFTAPEGETHLLLLIQAETTLLPVIIGGGLYLIYFLTKLGDNEKKTKLGSKTKDGKELSQYFDSRWVTEKELKNEKKFMYCNWNTLKSSGDGILIRSELKNGNLDINMYKPIHAMIIGTTGTGKTQKYIEPSIQILSSTRTKPSFVIADPKGEIYEKHSHKLKSEGYDVKVFNLRQPYASTRWNPLDNAYMMYHKAHHLYDDVTTHVGVNPADLKLKIIAKEYEHQWYEYGGVAYPSKEALDMDLSSKKAELIDLAENELREIATILCPIENKNDSSWDRGAQEFVYGTMMAMLEDSLIPELGMTRERFNFYNLARIANFKDPDPDNPYKTLRQYYLGRDSFSKVLQLVTTAINNAPTTTKSYMGIVSARLGLFNDSGMCFATSCNEMNFDTFADKPTALFIIIPDEKESRHGIATMMISQLYKKLVDLANNYPESKLPRAVYFLLDEFANLPKIEKIDTMITVSRSRNVFFSLVIQSFSQLNAKYGDDVAATLKGNCPIKIFIGTDDAKTCEEFSKLCGDITLETTSTSESRQKDEKGKENPNKTTSLSTTSRPLIYPDELGHLGNKDGTGEIIIKILNEFPIRINSTMAWATPMFDHTKASNDYVPSRSLDEASVAYSIANRNNFIFKPKPGAAPGAF
ncbi:MAG: type IV secretory system conjugative DNA transfer family protein [Clostridia bacterium]|nr:type IV secretory system conjugative DNA transfer family protein [Clostridia bacterium]